MRFPFRDLLLTVGVLAAAAGLVRGVVMFVETGPYRGGGMGILPEKGTEKGEGSREAAAEGGPAGAPRRAVELENIAAALNDAMADVVERSLPGVVSVHVDRQQVITETVLLPGALGPQMRNRTIRQPGVGSGVIVSGEGLVITNWHVVAGEDVLIRVTLHGDEEPRRAALMDRDESLDIALLRIEPRQPGETFPSMKFGDSDLMRPGHFVFALGNPLNLAETVTQGIISNRARRVSDTLDSYLQTDCTINPGNSGGPLVNLKGELIGINTRLVIGPQETPSGQAYGLAIPSNEVQDSYGRMMNKGQPRGYLGVTVDDWPVASYQTGRKPECAVVVGLDRGSPAAAAGLRKNDLIRSMAGEPVRGSADFFRRLRKRQVGETLELGVRRDGAVLTVRVEVVDLKSVFEAEEMPPSRQAAGLTVRGLRRAERAGRALPEPGAVLVEAVDAWSPLHGRLAPGDVILRISGGAAAPAAGNGGPEAGGGGSLEPPTPEEPVPPPLPEAESGRPGTGGSGGRGTADPGADFAARMEMARRSGGYLDVLRAQGTVERVPVPAGQGNPWKETEGP